MANPRLGKDGAIYLSTLNFTTAVPTGAIAHITDWELAINQDALEKTSFGDGYDRSYAVGLRGPVGTFNGYCMDTSTGGGAQQADLLTQYTGATPNTLLVALLTVSTAGSQQGWKGQAITQMTQGAAADGIQTISGTLQFADGISTFSSAT